MTPIHSASDCYRWGCQNVGKLIPTKFIKISKKISISVSFLKLSDVLWQLCYSSYARLVMIGLCWDSVSSDKMWHQCTVLQITIKGCQNDQSTLLQNTKDGVVKMFIQLNSVHFKNTVTRSSFHSTLWPFSIILSPILFWCQLMYYWKRS